MNQLLLPHAKSIAQGKGVLGRDRNLREKCRALFNSITVPKPTHVFIRGRFQTAIPEGGFNRKQWGALKRKS